MNSIEFIRAADYVPEMSALIIAGRLRIAEHRNWVADCLLASYELAAMLPEQEETDVVFEKLMLIFLDLECWREEQ